MLWLNQRNYLLGDLARVNCVSRLWIVSGIDLCLVRPNTRNSCSLTRVVAWFWPGILLGLACGSQSIDVHRIKSERDAAFDVVKRATEAVLSFG